MYKPKIIAFLCTWCSYAGADLAGTGRNQYPSDIRVIRVPCSGRINPIYIIKALLEGADGVMVSGCHPGDCHYLVGNYFARRRFTVLKILFTTAGINPDKVHFTWVSASEGTRFADVVKEITEKVSATKHSEKPSKGTVLPLDFHRKKPSRRTVPPLDIFSSQEKEMISVCKNLLDKKTVSSVIGFKKGNENGPDIPFFTKSPNDADDLVWSNRCIPVLSGYLRERKGKTAIIAKPCDTRAIINLIKENQLKRDDIYIIGMTCKGMVNENNELLPACSECRIKTPPICDIMIGEKIDISEIKNDDSDHKTAPSSIDAQTRFNNEIEKCILCYSCRQSCYGCYCTTCFMDRGEPDWQTPSPDRGAKMLYHLGRTTHLSGRCIQCGACENACASGVDIRYLIREVTNFIEDTYNYRTGTDPETEPVMLTYKPDDKEIGFLQTGGCKND